VSVTTADDIYMALIYTPRDTSIIISDLPMQNLKASETL
jgi:hypothetical protein